VGDNQDCYAVLLYYIPVATFQSSPSLLSDCKKLLCYPFQPLSNEEFKKSSLIKEFKKNFDTQRLRKDYNLPDRIISKIIRSASDQSSNHPQTDNS